jgi:hypothetical protein
MKTEEKKTDEGETDEKWMKQGSRELTFWQSDASIVIQVFQHMRQLTLCKLLSLSSREQDAHQEQGDKRHHYGCPQESEMGAPLSFTSFYSWRTPQEPSCQDWTCQLPSIISPYFSSSPQVSSQYQVLFSAQTQVHAWSCFPSGFVYTFVSHRVSSRKQDVSTLL